MTAKGKSFLKFIRAGLGDNTIKPLKTITYRFFRLMQLFGIQIAEY